MNEPSCPADLPPVPNGAEAETVLPPPLPETATVPPREGTSVAAASPGAVAPPGYEILGELGRGGMGLVYKARQTKAERLVALKMILAGGHAGPDDLARFRTEAEAIARIQHPGIVQVFDVGDHAGLPFFSLEFCAGGSLEKKLSGTPLPPAEAAALVEALARAVQAAHDRNVVHRDLKPANVLLTADGTPKLTDFGLAKKLDVAGPSLTGQVMGTPSYMAPEQAEGRRTVGPPADVYGLGAILYECLTTRPPFQAATLMDTLLQVVADEPVPPSRLNAQVPPDLETVCLKCLQKEAAKRYASATALAEDLRRFRAGEPIAARPVGTVERGWRWCRRNKALAASLAGVGLTLLLGTTVATAFGLHARAEAENARRSEERAKEEKATAEKERDDKEKARQAEATARQQTRAALDTMTEEIVERLMGRQLQLTDEDRAFLVKVRSYYEAFARDRSETEEGRASVADGRSRLGRIRYRLGELPEAEADLVAARDLRLKLAADFPTVPQHRSELAGSHNNLGILLRETGRPQEAETEYRAARDLHVKLAADFPTVPQHRSDLAGSHNNLGNLLRATGHPQEAETEYRAARDLQKKLVADFPTVPQYRRNLAGSQLSLGNLLSATGRLQEAETEYRAARDLQKRLAADFPNVPHHRSALAASHGNLGLLLCETGHPQEAETEYRAARDLFKQLAADFPTVPQHRSDLATSHNHLGLLLRATGRPQEAETEYRAARDLRKQLAADFPKVPQHRSELALSYNNLGALVSETSRPQEAETEYHAARDLQKKLAADFPAVPDYQNDLAGTLVNLAILKNDAKDHAAARRLSEEARPHHQAALNANSRHPTYRQFFRNNLSALCQALLGLRDHAAALTTAEELARFACEPPTDTYDAVCVVSLCIPLAAQDAALPEAKRRELAQSYSDKALTLLRQAVQQGFKNVTHLRNDTDLDPLRPRPDFQKLLADLDGPRETLPPPKQQS